jgi:cytochrome c553
MVHTTIRVRSWRSICIPRMLSGIDISKARVLWCRRMKDVISKLYRGAGRERQETAKCGTRIADCGMTIRSRRCRRFRRSRRLPKPAIIIGAVLANVSVMVVAQSSLGPEAYHGDAERGAKIAAWGTSKGVASCSSCHGYDGIGNGTSRVPRIAGQSSTYLVQQLDKYAGDKRQNVYMTNFE